MWNNLQTKIEHLFLKIQKRCANIKKRTNVRGGVFDGINGKMGCNNE